MKLKPKKKANMMLGTLGKIILIVIFIVVVLGIIFYIYPLARDSISDQTTINSDDNSDWQNDFLSSRRAALAKFSNVLNAFEAVAKAKAVNGKDTCFGTFEPPGEDFFKQGYNIEILDEPDGLSFVLLQYRTEQEDPDKVNKAETWEYLTERKKIEGFKPCVIFNYDSDALRFEATRDFYDDLIKKGVVGGKDVNGKDNVYGVAVPKLAIFPFKKIRVYIPNQKSYYTPVPNFLTGEDINKYLIFKSDDKLCLIPTIGGDNCDYVGTNTGIQDGCLDKDNGLQQKLNNELKSYVCKGFENSIANMEEK